MREQIKLLVCYLGCVISSAAIADERKVSAWLHEVKFGVLHHDTGDLWSGFRRERCWSESGRYFSPHIKFLGGTVRPALGGCGKYQRWYVQALLRPSLAIWARERYVFGIGLGGAIHDGKLHLQYNDRKKRSDHVLFHIPVEIIYRLTTKKLIIRVLWSRLECLSCEFQWRHGYLGRTFRLPILVILMCRLRLLIPYIMDEWAFIRRYVLEWGVLSK